MEEEDLDEMDPYQREASNISEYPRNQFFITFQCVKKIVGSIFLFERK